MGLYKTEDTVSIKIPAHLIENLKKESKQRRISVEKIIEQTLQDREDFLFAEKQVKDIKSGKSKLISQAVIQAKLGL